MLIAAVLIGCQSTNAQPELTINTFCVPLSSVAGYADFGVSKDLAQKLHSLKDEKQVEAALIEQGFNCDSKAEKKEYDDQMGEYVTFTVAKYSKTSPEGATTITKEGNEYTIAFPDSAVAKSFIDGLKASGYEYDESWGYIVPDNMEAHWVGISVYVDGKDVTIRSHGG